MAVDVEKEIYSSFAAVASALGYSEVHGRIIAALLVEDKPFPLQKLSKKTGYSLAAVSLSLDLLELLGIVRKQKKSGDRKVYAVMDGDLVEGIRNALLLKAQKELALAFQRFQSQKKSADAKNRKTISILEKELKRLEKYIKKLSSVDIPKS